MECEVVLKASEKNKGKNKKQNVLDVIQSKEVGFVVNLSQQGVKLEETRRQRHLSDGYQIRRAVVDNQIPLFTDLHLVRAFIKALQNYSIDDLEIKSYKEYLEN